MLLSSGLCYATCFQAFFEDIGFFLYLNSCTIWKKNISLHQIQLKMKRFFIIALTLAMVFAPISLLAETEHDGIEMSLSGISIIVNGGNVRVSGANGEVMEVFNLTGAKVATVRIDSNDKTFSLNLSKGCYLIKVGKIVRKISVQ